MCIRDRLQNTEIDTQRLSGIISNFASNDNLFKMVQDLNRIKIVLVEKKKTGKWLAEKLGVSACTVSRWASNTAQPNLSTLNEIAKQLGVDVKDLINSTE
mgnify:FL=1